MEMKWKELNESIDTFKNEIAFIEVNLQSKGLNNGNKQGKLFKEQYNDVKYIKYKHIIQWSSELFACIEAYFNDHCDKETKNLIIAIQLSPFSIEESAAIIAMNSYSYIYVPVDRSLPIARQIEIIMESKAKILITYPINQCNILRQYQNEIVKYTIIQSNIFPSIQISLLRGIENDISDSSINWRNVMYLLYTSGSTGNPQAVLGSRIGTLCRLQWIWETYPFQSYELVFRVTKSTFVDSIAEIFSGYYMHVPLVHIRLPEDQEIAIKSIVLEYPLTFLQVLKAYKVTRFTIIPSVLAILLRMNMFVECCTPSLKYILVSGEVLRWNNLYNVLSQLQNVTILNLYGTTEVSGDVTCVPFQGLPTSEELQLWKKHGVPIGEWENRIGGHETKLMIQHEDNEESNAGELIVSGPLLAEARTNKNDPGNLKNPFVWINGIRWLKTGDQCRVIEGKLYYIGRRNNAYSINLRGQLVQLEVIEHAVAKILTTSSPILSSTTIYEVVAYVVENNDSQQLVLSILVDDESKQFEACTFIPIPERIKLCKEISKEYGDLYVPHDIVLINSKAYEIKQRQSEKLKFNRQLIQDMSENYRASQTNDVSMYTSQGSLNIDKVMSMLRAKEVGSITHGSELLNHTLKDLGCDSLQLTLLQHELEQQFNLLITIQELQKLSINCIQKLIQNTAVRKRRRDFTDTKSIKKKPTLKSYGRCYITTSLSWTISLDKCIDASPTFLVCPTTGDKYVFIGSHAGIFMCLKVKDNQYKINWSITLDNRIQATASASASHNLVFIGSYSGTLYAIEISTGSVKWSFRAKGEIKASVLVLHQHNLLVIGSYDHYLYSVDLTSGENLWKINMSASISSTSIYLNELHLMICATTSGFIRAFKVNMLTSTMQNVWDQTLPAPVFADLKCLTNSRCTIILAPCADGNLYGLNGNNGIIIWQIRTTKPIFSSPLVLTETAAIVLGSHDGKLRRIDNCYSEACNIVWTSEEFLSPIYSSPAIFHFKNSMGREEHIIICTTTAGHVAFIDYVSGITLSIVDISRLVPSTPKLEIFSSPIIIGNLCLLGTRPHNFIALEISIE